MHSHVIGLKHIRNFSETEFFWGGELCNMYHMNQETEVKRCLMYIERCHYTAYIVKNK